MIAWMGVIVTDVDIGRIKEAHPDIECIYDDNGRLISLSGFLQFSMRHNPNDYCQRSLDTNTSFINCSYNVLIEFPLNDIPIVKEVGNKITNYAKELDKRATDLHYNNSKNICCLFPSNQRPLVSRNLSLIGYITKWVYPFFYSIEYYKKYQERPFGEYPHGDPGIMLFFNQQSEEIKESILFSTLNDLQFKSIYLGLIYGNRFRIRGHHKCFCGSGKLLKNCHLKIVKKFMKYILTKREYIFKNIFRISKT